MIGIDLVSGFVGAAPDANVAAAQRALAAAGFNGQDGKPLKADGIMGPNTASAITAFWTSRGASRPAIVDAELLEALGTTGTSAKTGGGLSEDTKRKLLVVGGCGVAGAILMVYGFYRLGREQTVSALGKAPTVAMPRLSTSSSSRDLIDAVGTTPSGTVLWEGKVSRGFLPAPRGPVGGSGILATV